MDKIILYAHPGACSRVTMCALEEIGLTYESRSLNYTRRQHRSPEYLAINPKRQVPALKIGDSRFFTENAAILYYLHGQYPAARILPEGDAVPINQGLEDLLWCASMLHPMTRQVRMPSLFTTRDPEGVNADGIEKYQPVLVQLQDRLSGGRWWYGDHWSIFDVYLYWNYSNASHAGLDLAAAPALEDHTNRVRSRPSFLRTLSRETELVERYGLQLPPGRLL